MAKILVVGLEPSPALQVCAALTAGFHEAESKPAGIPPSELLQADLILAAGGPSWYLPLLRQLRAVRPDLPFIIVTRLPEIAEWLDALEAGATDYCALPLSSRQLAWLLECALPKHLAARI